MALMSRLAASLEKPTWQSMRLARLGQQMGSTSRARPSRSGSRRWLRRPQTQVAKDLPDNCRIVDEGDHAHGALAPRAFERIKLVNLVNQAPPGGPHARSLPDTDFARCDFRRFG